jgi:hypothetical protein
MHKHTWVSKLKNPKLTEVCKPYALMYMGFQAPKSRVELSLKTICAYAHGFSSLEI